MRTLRQSTTNLMTGLGRQQPLRDASARVDNRPPEIMAPEDRAMVLRGLEQVRNGEIATEAEIQATLARYGL